MEQIKTPKITVMIPVFTSGGLERVMITLANGLKRRGFDIDVLTLNGSGPLRSSLDGQIAVIDYGVPNVRYRNSTIPLIKFFQHNAPNIFISSLFNEPALIAHMVTRSKSKMIVTVHGSARNEIKTEKRKFARLTATILSRTLLKRAGSIVAVSNGIRNEILLDRSITPDKVRVIYNPIVTKDFFDKIKEPANHPWFQEPDIPIIMSLGRLTASKCFDVLIKAFALLAKDLKVRLMIVGDGEEMENLKTLAKQLGIENDAAFPGFQKNPLPFLAKANLFAFASRSEGFANVIVEAMFCGTSVVSTDCPNGPKEILEDGRYGALVEVGDVNGLADAMKQTLAHQTDRKVLRRRALEFSEDAAIDKYSYLLSKMTD